MSHRVKFAVCCEIHIKLINELCEKNEKFLNVRTGGTYVNKMVFTSQTQLLFLYLMYYLGNMFRLVIEYIN